MHANYCNMSIVFHENRTTLKMEEKEDEETIKTMNFSCLKLQSIKSKYIFT